MQLIYCPQCGLLLPAGAGAAQAPDAAAFQIVPEQDGSGDAVHVVVAEDGHGLPLRDGPLNPGHGLVHIPHPHGGESQPLLPVQVVRGGLRRGDPPGRQHRGEEIGIPRLPQPGDVLLLWGVQNPLFELHRTPPPFLPQRPFGRYESIITIALYQKRSVR